MIDKILKLGIKAVCVSWALWVLLDYLAFHPSVTSLLGDHPYASLLVILGIGAAGMGFLSHRKLKKQGGEVLVFHYRGIILFLATQLAVVLLLTLYLSENPLPGLPSVTRSLYFLIYGNGYLLMLSLLVIIAQNIGDFLLSPIKDTSLAGKNVLAVALGFSLIGTLGAILGLFDLLSPYVLWPLLLLPVGLRWRASLAFLKGAIWGKKKISVKKWWTPAVAMIMLLVVAYYWLAAFKNIPIGYDGSGLYVNLARLVADKNGLPAGGQAFAWSLVMGMGEVLFDNQLMSILLSHVMSIFCLFAIFQLARRFLSFDFSLLATLVSGVAPYFAFHGIVDEKVDLALTFVVLSALLLLFQLAKFFYPQREGEVEDEDHKTVARIQFGSRFSISTLTYGMLLVGWLLGFAFSIKYTAIFALFAIGGWWFYLRGGQLAFGAALSLILGLVLGGGIYRFGYLSITAAEANLAGGGFILLGVGLFVLAFRKKTQLLLPAFGIFPAMGLAFLLAFSPWAVKHLSENDSFGVNSLLEGKTQSPEIQLMFDFELSLLPEWNIRGKRDFWSDDPRTTNQRYRGEYYNFGEMTQAGGGQADGFNTTLEGFNEEISRYAGFEAVFWRFHSLPYDLTVNNNVRNGRYLNIGFYFLLLLPLLIILPARYSRKRAGLGLLLFCGALFYVAMVYLSIYAPTNGEIDYATLSAAVADNLTGPSGATPWWAGIYLFFSAPFVYLATLSVPLYQSLAQAGTVITILSMLLFTTLGFLVVRQRLGGLPQDFKAFGGFLLTYGFFWWFMGNAIIWYAMPLFVLFPIFLLYWLEKPEDFLGPQETAFSRYFLGIVTTLVVVVSTCVHFSSPFPTDDGGAALLRYPFVDYMTNPSAREVDVLKAYNPVLDDLQRSVNADPEGKIYRVNTHYGYLIENNDTRVFSDPVLERYGSVIEELDDDANFFKLLKQQGFAFILLDLKMGSQDQTPEKALRNKFVSLAKQLMQSEDVQLLVTDNYIADPQAPAVRLRNGQFANARYGLAGQTVQLGNLALFKLR